MRQAYRAPGWVGAEVRHHRVRQFGPMRWQDCRDQQVAQRLEHARVQREELRAGQAKHALRELLHSRPVGTAPQHTMKL